MESVRRGLVIGGGGTLGLAWAVGALSVVERSLAWDARTATVIVGVGSGAEAAAALGAGYAVEELVRALTGHPEADPFLAEQFAAERRIVPGLAIPAPSSIGLAVAGLRGKVPMQAGLQGLLPVGTGSFERVVELGRELALRSTGRRDGWVRHPHTWLAAADRRTGDRVAFGQDVAPRTDLGAALAAATARPGWFPPVRIGGQAYVDASLASSTSADLVLSMRLDELVMIAPTASRDAGLGGGLALIERMLRRGTTMRLDLEERVLQAEGVRVIRVEPGPVDLSATGVNPMDHRRRRDVTLTALTTTPPRVALAIQRSGIGLAGAAVSGGHRVDTRTLRARQRLALPTGRLVADDGPTMEIVLGDRMDFTVDVVPPEPKPVTSRKRTLLQRLLRR